MVSLKAFISAIHGAVLEAGDALMDRNIGLIERFFESAGEDVDLQNALNRVLRATSRLLEQSNHLTTGDFQDLLPTLRDALNALPPDEQKLRNLLLDAARKTTALVKENPGDPTKSNLWADTQKSVKALHDALYQPDSSGVAKNPVTGTLRPRAVTVEFPSLAADGTVEVVDVQVPLISLVPLSMSEVKKARLKTKFELHVDNDELQIGFPGKRKKKDDNDNDLVTTGTLDIVIEMGEPSEGLKTVVDAYDQTLRAQIPH